MKMSTIFKCGVCGIEEFIVGMKATKAKANREMVDSLKENEGY